MTAATAPIAAFFDLDKTVIARSSAIAFFKPLYEQGLMNRRSVLKSSYAQFIYLLTAADADQVSRLRNHVTEMAAGWNVEQVRGVVEETLDDVVSPLIFAEAAELIAGHQAQGHDVVIVSASGSEVVEPISRLLGADHWIASRMAVDDGRYTGDLEFYCYGPAKAESLTQLAAERGYDLAASYAYSDSVTDLPMLDAVGHPTAVNPDRALRKEAKARNWPVLQFSRPVTLREHRARPSKRGAVAAVIGSGAMAAGAITYSLLRHRHR